MELGHVIHKGKYSLALDRRADRRADRQMGRHKSVSNFPLVLLQRIDKGSGVDHMSAALSLCAAQVEERKRIAHLERAAAMPDGGGGGCDDDERCNEDMRELEEDLGRKMERQMATDELLQRQFQYVENAHLMQQRAAAAQAEAQRRQVEQSTTTHLDSTGQQVLRGK